ncbi:uncharacterized protein LOC125773629 [Anopheles funestus]|uniref:uncharacterized protein LOC125773629 n=1 Tax=Anopheles funestus TaxID=62324 RepID=UPI0020C6645C|nr:uncharacterized protein LOC125773629 [Anopheles funestus]
MTTKDATLYVSNISDFINEDIMLDFFSTRGSVKRVQIKWNVFGYRYAIVTFYSQYCAKLTLKECCGTHLGDGYHWNITDEYYPYNDGPLTPINYRNLHCMRQKEGYVRISGLTSTVTESELNALFRNVGCYTRTILLRYGGNPSGYAIARFPTERAALLGIRRFNNFSRNGMTMKLEYVRVNWAPTHCPDVKWNAIPKVRSKK